MQTNSTISVIVPVYNAEKYLPRCIESILRQTYPDFELLLVDDGSTDGSGNILDEYASRDSRIEVFHQRNSGVTIARSYILKKVNGGGYAAFIDADDEIPKDALKTLYEATEEGKYDIVIGQWPNAYIQPKVYTAEEYRRAYFAKGGMGCAFWGRLISKRLLNDEVFDLPREIVKGEDLLMNIRLAFANTKQVKVISNIVYHYQPVPQSLVNTFKPSLDYEKLFYKHLLRSIPLFVQEEYMRSLISARLDAIWLIALLNNRNLKEKHLYIQDLKHDIEKHGYHLSLRERILLGCPPWFLVQCMNVWKMLIEKIYKKRT